MSQLGPDRCFRSFCFALAVQATAAVIFGVTSRSGPAAPASDPPSIPVLFQAPEPPPAEPPTLSQRTEVAPIPPRAPDSLPDATASDAHNPSTSTADLPAANPPLTPEAPPGTAASTPSEAIEPPPPPASTKLGATRLEPKPRPLAKPSGAAVTARAARSDDVAHSAAVQPVRPMPESSQTRRTSGASAAVAFANAESSLEARIREAVQAAVQYPAAARMMSLRGRARVRLDYQDGAVGYVELAQSAGNGLLDNAAMKAVRQAQYPRPPSEIAGRLLRLLVWVDFS